MTNSNKAVVDTAVAGGKINSGISVYNTNLSGVIIKNAKSNVSNLAIGSKVNDRVNLGD